MNRTRSSSDYALSIGLVAGAIIATLYLKGDLSPLWGLIDHLRSSLTGLTN